MQGRDDLTIRNILNVHEWLALRSETPWRYRLRTRRLARDARALLRRHEEQFASIVATPPENWWLEWGDTMHRIDPRLPWRTAWFDLDSGVLGERWYPYQWILGDA